MSILAKEIVARIKRNQTFSNDLKDLYSVGVNFYINNKLIVNEELLENISFSFKRLIESAYIMTQTDNDADKNMAQSIAYYIFTLTKDEKIKRLAIDLLGDLGNFPGANYLKSTYDHFDSDFFGFLRNQFLEKFNEVKIEKSNFILTDFQRKIWDSIDSKSPQAISAPTSAGKSFVVLEILVNNILYSNISSVVYIAPTRALVNEISEKISKKLENHKANIRVSTIPTINTSFTKQIFVLTQERLQVLLELTESQFDLIVVDEAQSISDDIRGMILQDCLEKISNRNALAKFILLAPGAEGFDGFKTIINKDEILVERTDYSPVVQNKIIVDVDPANENKLRLNFLNSSERIYLGSLLANRGFANVKTRLAAIALELGSEDGSLVYGTGAANAELIARQIASDLIEKKNDYLNELSKFIKKHVHKEYSLAQHVLKGVAYHYGKMPSLLRESLEKGFISNNLKYLVCTTTLFQGVNLPAKNVFIDTPTRGNRGEKLDEAELWNFAGRAGRLGYAFSGNVYLVDYETWDTHPLDNKIDFKIIPAFKSTLDDAYDQILNKLDIQNNVNSQSYTNVDAAAGFLISRAARGDIDIFLEKSLSGNNKVERINTLASLSKKALRDINMPTSLLALNWTVNPFGQSKLYKRFHEKIDSGEVDSLIPRHPSENVYQIYIGVFSRINKYILGNNTSKFSNYLTAMSLNWMRGKSLPEIISLSIKKKKEVSKDGNVNVDRVVREVFDFIEETLRFKYVQLGRAYVDLLRQAMIDKGFVHKVSEIYDFPLALELGVSSIAGQIFIELGLSRITAATLETLIPNSNPSIEDARNWLASLDNQSLDLPFMMSQELKDKNLVNF